MILLIVVVVVIIILLLLLLLLLLIIIIYQLIEDSERRVSRVPLSPEQSLIARYEYVALANNTSILCEAMLLFVEPE